MKPKHLLPFAILLSVVLGCSQLRDMSSRGNTPSNDPNTSSPGSPASNAAPASPGAAPSGDARADIDRMADAFLAQRSFRAKMVGSGQTPVNTELEFVAPDRFRIRNSQGPEMLVIGKDVYMGVGGRWQKVPGNLGGSVPDMRKEWDKKGRTWISDPKYVGEETVDGKPAYVYTYFNKGVEGMGANDSKIWIAKSDGLPVRIEATYKSGPLKTMTIDYDYDANISIEPPVR